MADSRILLNQYLGYRLRTRDQVGIRQLTVEARALR